MTSTNPTIVESTQGSLVKELQGLLSNLKYKITVDGSFGPGTKKIVIDFQTANNLTPNGVVDTITWNKLYELTGMSNSDLYENYYLQANEYYAEEVKKTTIFIHHTAGGPNPYFVIQGWENDKSKDGKILPVATAFVIGGPDTKKPQNDGLILRAFDEKFWCHHLGTTAKNNKKLNQQSIGIEVCNYGGLTKTREGKFLTYVNTEIAPQNVITLDKPWRGYQYYQEYSDKQIESLRKLLIYLADKYKINIKKEWTAKYFDIDDKALTDAGTGLFTHVNVRADKSDMSPSPKLIAMLNTL